MTEQNFLPPGYLLRNFQIADDEDYVLGAGGFGITYYAVDVNLNRAVAIKEYMPRDYALRDGVEVLPMSGTKDGLSCEEVYQSGLQKFREEGMKLAIFEHPHINQVLARFEANGTAYLVLGYIDGAPLSAVLERDGYLDERRLRRLLNEVLSGLEEVHSQRIYHRDLKPGNIMLRAGTDGGPAESAVLIDFGSAREDLGNRPHSQFQALTQGYAAIEQENPLLANGYDIGPWTDLYALGMIAYQCIAGSRDQDLINATSRVGLVGLGRRDEDLLPAEEVGRDRYTENLLKVIDWAIKVNPQARPQSVAEMREALIIGTAPATATEANASASPPRSRPKPGRVAHPQQPDDTAAPPVDTEAPSRWKIRRVLWWVLGFALVGAASGGWLVLQKLDCHDRTKLESYLAGNPNGIRADVAQVCLAVLKRADVKRQQAAVEAERKAESEAKRKAEAEAEAERKAEAKRKAEAEAKRKAEAEAERKAEAKRKAEAEAKRKAEAERLEKVRLAAEAEVKRLQAERLVAEAEVKRLQEERLAAEAEAKRQEEERQRLAAEAEAKRQEEERQRLAAEAEAKRQEEERQRLAAEAEAKRQEEERQRLAAEAEAKRQEEERQRLAAEAKRQEESAWKAADTESINLSDKTEEIHNQEKATFKFTDAQRAWLRGIKKLDAYLAAYPNGTHILQAEARIKSMVEIRTNGNFTPLHWAAYFNDVIAAKILIARDADVNAGGVDGSDPVTRLFKGVFSGAKTLLTQGIDQDARWAGGGMPLHFAALNDAIDVAKILIENDADVNAKSIYSKTPLQVAKIKNHSAMETLLKKNGGR